MPAPTELVTVDENGIRPYGRQIRIGHHVLSADEPEPDGQGTGPSPYDLLLAALGSCTSMTVRAYADRKGLPLERISVSLRHDQVRAVDHADGTDRTDDGHVDTGADGLVFRITREIRLDGDLDAGQRKRLMQVAEHCPVRRILTESALVRTTEAPARP